VSGGSPTGDYLRALAALGVADDAACAAVGRMLGIEVGVRGSSAAAAKTTVSERPAAPAESAGVATERRAAPAPRAALPEAKPIRKATLRDLGRESSAPEWLASAQPLPAPVSATKPFRTSLFPKSTVRGVLGLAASAPSARGEVELDRVLEAVAKGEVLRSIPKRSVWTLARGVTLLIDERAAMEPFREDVRQLQQDARDLVGRELTRIASFWCLPLEALLLESDESEDGVEVGLEQAITRGATVMCITDLGIGRSPAGDARPSAAQWLALASEVEQQGCRFVALVPYRRARWPKGLEGKVAIIPWSPSTTAGAVAQALRVGRRREAGADE